MKITKWHELTPSELRDLASKGAIAVIPVGSIEYHGEHLPLGTDALTVYEICVRAAEKTLAVVLPPIYYAYVPENRHKYGTISLKAETFLKLLEEICDEIARHGFKKILIVNGHGGNRRPLNLFIRELLFKEKNYVVYVLADPWSPIEKVIKEVAETIPVGHACEVETSIMLYLRPDLCKLEKVEKPAKTGKRPLIDYVQTPVDWCAYAIEGYVGDPRAASREKGRKIVEAWVEKIAELIEEIRADREALKWLKKYRETCSHE